METAARETLLCTVTAFKGRRRLPHLSRARFDLSLSSPPALSFLQEEKKENQEKEGRKEGGEGAGETLKPCPVLPRSICASLLGGGARFSPHTHFHARTSHVLLVAMHQELPRPRWSVMSISPPSAGEASGAPSPDLLSLPDERSRARPGPLEDPRLTERLVWGEGHPKLQEGAARTRTRTGMCVCVCLCERRGGG